MPEETPVDRVGQPASKKSKAKPPNRKASFYRKEKPRGAVKSKVAKPERNPRPWRDDHPDVVDNIYKGTYDISSIPLEAFPQKGKINKGVHSYTISSSIHMETATIEVLLRHSAFFVKKASRLWFRNAFS